MTREQTGEEKIIEEYQRENNLTVLYRTIGQRDVVLGIIELQQTKAGTP